LFLLWFDKNKHWPFGKKFFFGVRKFFSSFRARRGRGRQDHQRREQSRRIMVRGRHARRGQEVRRQLRAVQEIRDFDAISLAISVYDIGESSKQIKL
jgi:hypothetical protein